MLRDSVMWSAEQPRRVGVLTGFVKSVRKMTGVEPRIPTPSQVESGGGKTERDLVQQMAEIRVNRRALHDSSDPVRNAGLARSTRAFAVHARRRKPALCLTMSIGSRACGRARSPWQDSQTADIAI